MKRLTLFLLAALVAAPSFAGSMQCTTAMVTAGICRATTERVIFLSVAQAHIPNVVDALADEAGWTATVPCTQAMVDLSQCTAEQLGEPVTNPVTKAVAADRQFRARLVNLVRSYLAESVHASAEQVRADGLAAIEVPDLGN